MVGVQFLFLIQLSLQMPLCSKHSPSSQNLYRKASSTPRKCPSGRRTGPKGHGTVRPTFIDRIYGPSASRPASFSHLEPPFPVGISLPPNSAIIGYAVEGALYLYSPIWTLLKGHCTCIRLSGYAVEGALYLYHSFQAPFRPTPLP